MAIYKLPPIAKYIPILDDISTQIYWANTVVKLYDIVRIAFGGNRKLIRSGAIRIGYKDLIKNWSCIKDPLYDITKSCYIAKGKGAKLIYLWIDIDVPDKPYWTQHYSTKEL